MTPPKFRLQAVQGWRRRWLPTAAVCARYDISETTLSRWVNNPDLGFPGPMKVTEGGGNFYPEEDLDEFDRRRVELARERRARKVRTTIGP